MANNSVGFKKFLNMLAFIAIIAVAAALLFVAIFGKSSSIGFAFTLVAQCIAYLVTAIYAFYYIYSMRNTALTIVYFVAVITIIVLLIVAAA